MAWCPNCKCEFEKKMIICPDCGCELQEQIEKEKPVYHGRYINNEEMAEENRSSAAALLLTGGIGLVLMVLFFFDLLPVRMGGVNKYLISGVMGTLFVLFFIMGVVSLRNFKVLSGKAQKENNLTEQIRKWCLDNLTKAGVDEALSFDDEMTEEVKYFQRLEEMKKLVNKQFMNLDERYLDRLMDEVYPFIFEDGRA